MSTKQSQAGFTLLELMIVVVVMGILAAIAYPAFAHEVKVGRYDSEAKAVISELLAKDHMFKIENGRWKTVAPCTATPDDNGVSVDTCLTAGSDWAALKAAPHIRKLRCTYQVATGCASDTALTPVGVTFRYGAESWAYAVAVCGTGSDSYTYFASSTNSTVQRLAGTLAFTATNGCSTTGSSASGSGSGSGSGAGSGGGADPGSGLPSGCVVKKNGKIKC